MRALTTEDAPTCASWAADPEFRAAAEWNPDRSTAELTRWWQGLIASPPPELIRLGAESEGALVGYVDLHGTAPDVRELGFLVGPRKRWGHGYGYAIAAAGLHHGFVAMGMRRIWAEAAAANTASLRILQRLGMRETGTGDPTTYLGAPTIYRQFEITPAGRDAQILSSSPPR